VSWKRQAPVASEAVEPLLCLAMRIASAVLALFVSSTLALGQATPQPPSAPQPAAPTAASQTPAANPDDVKSLDAIMHAVYDVISGPAGQKRNWERFRSLFADGARLIPVSRKQDGSGYASRVLSVEDYASRGQGFFDKEGFYESEVARRVEQWGHIAQVFSTYESRHEAGGAPFQRGINSFQLYNDGQRWWVVTIFWEGETKDTPIPAEFLKSGK
jgi:hypothetical protein